jgi:hypothetical protein
MQPQVHDHAATHDAIHMYVPPGSKERSQALYRHSNPPGNPYALCHSECDIEKLKFFVKDVEIILIDDAASGCASSCSS